MTDDERKIRREAFQAGWYQGWHKTYGLSEAWNRYERGLLPKGPHLDAVRAKLAEIHKLADTASRWTFAFTRDDRYDATTDMRARIRTLAREAEDLLAELNPGADK